MTTLCDIATKHGTDKAPWCWGYTVIYHDWLDVRRPDINTVLEIGVLEGASLRTWRDYFPAAMVYGVDNNEKCAVNEDRIKTYIRDAYDRDVMSQVMSDIGPVDFLVDDAIHTIPAQTDLLAFMWPHLRDGGVYAIEEAHDNSLGAIMLAALSLPGVVRAEIVYSKQGYSLILLQKGRK